VVKGSLGPNPAEMLRAVMASVKDKLLGPIAETDEDKEPKAGEWALIRNQATGRFDGKIKIRLRSTEEVIKLETELHSAPILIGGEMALVQVINSKVSQLPTCSSGKGPGHPATSRGRVPLGR